MSAGQVVGSRRPSSADCSPQESRRPWRSRRPQRWVWQALGLYVASRVVVGSAALVALFLSPGRPLRTWDALYYLSIARDGYPSTLNTLAPGTQGSDLGFFPGYPVVVRLVGLVLGRHWVVAAYMTNLVLGAALVCLLRTLVARLVDGEAGDKVAALYAFWPGTMSFSLPSSEPLALCAVTVSFLAMGSRRWVLAGCAAAVATASRPNMLPVVAALGLWAVLVAHRDRAWRALIAPVLAPMGTVAFFVYLKAHTGDLLIWQEAERRYWQQNLDFGRRLPSYIGRNLRTPFTAESPNAYLLVLGAVFIVVGLVLLLRQRLPLPFVVFTLGVLALCLLYSNFGPRLRFVASAFPLFIGLAARLPWRATWLWVALSSGGLALETVLVLVAPHSYP